MIPFIILLLLAFYNGLIIHWFNSKNKPEAKKYSNLWHTMGWFIRLFVILLLPIKFIPLGIFVGWSCYNYLINLILNKPMFYVGITGTDQFLTSKKQIVIDSTLLLISIIFLITL